MELPPINNNHIRLVETLLQQERDNRQQKRWVYLGRYTKIVGASKYNIAVYGDRYFNPRWFEKFLYWTGFPLQTLTDVDGNYWVGFPTGYILESKFR